MEQVAPGVRRQTGKAAVDQQSRLAGALARLLGIGTSRVGVEQGIYQVEAELAAIQPQVLRDEANPLLRLRPALDRKTVVDAKMDTRSHTQFPSAAESAQSTMTEMAFQRLRALIRESGCS